MLTEDENIVEVPLTVQYKISNLQDFVLNVDQPEISLQHATDSALRHVVGSTAMDQVLTEGRELMASEIKERLQRFLDTYRTGITVTQVNVQSAAAPREVQEAFDDVIRAREDEQRSQPGGNLRQRRRAGSPWSGPAYPRGCQRLPGRNGLARQG